MRNFDKRVLRNSQIRPDTSYPNLHQSFRLAMHAEFEARAFYRGMVAAFGTRTPFPALLATSEKRVGWLIAMGQKLGIACPLDTFSAQTSVEASWLGNCTRAANGVSTLARLYQNLLPHAGTRVLSNLFTRLLRQSINRQLPLLLQAISVASEQERFHAAHGIPPEEAYMKHGLFSTILEKAFSVLGADHRTIGLFSPVLRSTNPALLAGMVVGGAAAFALKKKSSFKRKEG